MTSRGMEWTGLGALARTGLERLGLTASAIAPPPCLVAVQPTPDSPLAQPGRFRSRFIGRRTRLATCSGVAWFHGSHIASVNLLANAIHTYRFDETRRTCSPMQSLVDPDGVAEPENLAFSPDGLLLAVTSSRGGAVTIYAVDGKTHRIDPQPAARIACDGDINAHGLGFSPCGRFLAFTTVDDPGVVRVFTIARVATGGIVATPLQALANARAPLKPKGIDFSPDGECVALCYAPNAGTHPGGYGGLLALHRFRPDSGLEPEPFLTAGAGCRLRNPDDLRFLPDGGHLVVTDQGADRALVVAVDADRRSLRLARILEARRAQLSFPHGVGVSRDGRYLAIANYGTDAFNIYACEASS